MNQVNWFQAAIDLLQAIISGVFVGLVIYWLDERRAKRERRLSDYRIASSWETSKPKVSLRNYDLINSNLSGYDFSGANFERAIFRNAYLRLTKFTDANLRMTDFHNTQVAATDFTNAVVFYSDFSHAVIRSRSDEQRMDKPDFTDANFRGVNFQKTKISDAIFHHTILMDADFSGAIIKDCDFTGSDLRNSKWNKVKPAENCVWKNVNIGDSKNLPSWLLEEIQSQNRMPNRNKKNGK